ncbi:hypothetical protein GGQ95_003155 [Anoxybacillus rupiensis]|nr:hypothetical protein [Anoxybacillus rupiensis]
MLPRSFRWMKRRIRELLTLSFIDWKGNILFLGPPGTLLKVTKRSLS